MTERIERHLKTLKLEVRMEVDGRQPSQEELDEIIGQILREWPILVYPYGAHVGGVPDKNNGALTVKEFTAEFSPDL